MACINEGNRFGDRRAKSMRLMPSERLYQIFRTSDEISSKEPARSLGVKKSQQARCRTFQTGSLVPNL